MFLFIYLCFAIMAYQCLVVLLIGICHIVLIFFFFPRLIFYFFKFTWIVVTNFLSCSDLQQMLITHMFTELFSIYSTRMSALKTQFIRCVLPCFGKLQQDLENPLLFLHLSRVNSFSYGKWTALFQYLSAWGSYSFNM